MGISIRNSNLQLVNCRVEKERILTCLATGDMKVVGQFAWGSNYTFLANVEDQENKFEAVYKPQRGERPLWDFPAETLAGREVAAYLVSEALGWGLVPPTVFREDGPLGPGSLQQRVDHDPEQHYFTFDEVTRQRLRPVALFDIIVNNADRKGGHLLLAGDGKLWLIDHGICFHEEPKLRTVVWDFVGERIPQPLLDDIGGLQTRLGGSTRQQLAAFLSEEELTAMELRIKHLLAERHFPASPADQRATPWPPV
jgi:hypothetical protein